MNFFFNQNLSWIWSPTRFVFPRLQLDDNYNDDDDDDDRSLYRWFLKNSSENET